MISNIAKIKDSEEDRVYRKQSKCPHESVVRHVWNDKRWMEKCESCRKVLQSDSNHDLLPTENEIFL